MNKIEIAKVMVFDDKDCFKEKSELFSGIKQSMKRSFKKNKTLENFEISENLEVKLFFIKDETYCEFGEGDSMERQVDWCENIEVLFSSGVGCIVLCDYQWKGEDSDINRKVFEAVRDNSNVIFVAYTSVMFREAQHWIDTLIEDAHKCKIVDVLLSIPSDNVSGTLRSLEEAMCDEW